MIPHGTHLTAKELDALVLELLSPESRRQLELHLEICRSCTRRLSEREQGEQHFRSAVLPRTLPALVSRRRRRSLENWSVLVVPALAAAVLFLVMPRTESRGGPVTEAAQGPIAIKGAPAIHVFAQRAGAAVPGEHEVLKVTEQTRLRRGDRVRFVIDASGATNLLIVSVDGAGKISTYYPARGEVSGAIDPAARFVLPWSISLDDAPGPERVFAFFSSRPIAASAVRAALAPLAAGGPAAIRALARAALPDVTQSSFLMERAR